MRRLAIFGIGIALIVSGLTYISWPVGHIPPYDANLVRLAETEAQGYCTGFSFINSAGQANPTKVKDCRKKHRGLSDKPNIQNVLQPFCQGVKDGGWQGSVKECLQIMIQQQYWPTYSGTITDAWNRARPYPLAFISAQANNQGDSSRTGSHNGSERSNNPTHEIPYP